MNYPRKLTYLSFLIRLVGHCVAIWAIAELMFYMLQLKTIVEAVKSGGVRSQQDSVEGIKHEQLPSVDRNVAFGWTTEL